MSAVIVLVITVMRIADNSSSSISYNNERSNNKSTDESVGSIGFDGLGKTLNPKPSSPQLEPKPIVTKRQLEVSQIRGYFLGGFPE